MLDVYSVAFFGHRWLDNTFEVEKKLKNVIRELLEEKEYVEFLVGRNGEFDTSAASCVRMVKKEFRNDNSSLVLVLPYMTAEFQKNEKNYYTYYDEVELCYESSQAHFKSAIGIRNKKIAERADCVVCYIERESGGAYAAVKYAEGLGKKVINLSGCDRE